MNEITTRDFDKTTDKDASFTYSLLCQRYSNSRSMIKFVTPTDLPSFDQHKQFIDNCLLARISTVNKIDVGFSYVDKKHHLGHFYNFSALKVLYKQYRITGEDISVAIFKEMGSRLPKGTIVFAQISSKNTTALRLADRTMEHISTLYGYEI
jgi:hypothetical protein